MSNFFRRLRRPNLGKGRLTQYLLYAIGEIVLVVLGILIALQFNTWNLEHNNRKEEQFYLKKLRQNLVQDTVYLNQRLVQLKNSNASLDTIKAEILNKDIDSFTNPRAGTLLLGVFEFSPQKSTFDNLISTGKLDLLRNQKLVDSIFTYYNDLGNFPQQRNESLRTYSRQTIGPYVLHQTGGAVGLRKIPESYRKDPFIINAIDLRKLIMTDLIDDYQRILNRCKTLMGIISEEIKS